ncbi:DNA mismatch repair endonuclease MutL [Flavobacteriaceae bacterium]|nr:DNA mismatch repair endonuclease MutL [Flavobacteriaceae bacterium]
MTQIIKRLEAHVANQIAAGEVVQRPASLVKELLENAVDAGATEIALHIKEGGKLLVQVIDNGVGMSAQDAVLCFERHATSKLQTAEDLFKIQTKGFRGEALASIAAIAQVVLKTRTQESELGREIHIAAGKLEENIEVVTPVGTSFAVNNLFYNIPARRNFLKSKQVEQRHITDEFHRLALVHPGIKFSFFADGAPLFVLPSTSFNQRIVQIFGKKIQDKLVPVKEETPQLKISGFVLKPESAKKSKGTQFFFVNQRFIKSNSLHFAVVNAFEGLIANGVHPGYFLQIEVDPQTIDINIHPTKTEIKFEDEHTLFAILRSAIKHSLGQFNVAPVLDFERDPNLDNSYDTLKKPAPIPHISVDASFNPFEIQETPNSLKQSSHKPQSSYASKNTFYQKPSSWESLYSNIAHDSNEMNVLEPSDAFNKLSQGSNDLYAEESHMQAGFFDAQMPSKSTHNCFQLGRKYLVSSTKSGLLVIHQSRAHQRVLYERFLTNFTHQEAASQQLLFPKELSFTIPEIMRLKELMSPLHLLGFNMEIKDNQTLSISGIPIVLQEKDVSQVIQDFLSTYEAGHLGDHFSQTDILAKALAKSMGIKTGDVLELPEQLNLIDELFACKEFLTSPFGKSVMTNLQQTDLDLKFL